ncbi:LuxR C-terminal-related transcriptional regulator [Desulfoplanes formicivorans]|uniref:LuxR family transcriptional regulator n=1 Tax=Desulfoplanes formicivorans TaxID=1592317 RepID=A0A194AEC2_9BACT|nr:LuxR C-terminal-related transcriptional regulator [Desulfoplanes formicivorans]GAU08432.1 LuxR family transcriptional regulator [Desulfoplanes formicivorans]
MYTSSSQVDTSVLYFSQRLMDALAVIHAGPATYIHAPMGYGKTVAVRTYLETHKARSIWVSVLTRDQCSFWQDFCHVLRRTLPRETAVLEDLEKLGYPTDPSKMDAARRMFARLAFPAETVLVFDDVHLLPDAEEERLFRFCLLLIRQGFGHPIVFISRHAPGKEYAESLLKGMIAEINPLLFVFSKEEIAAYFRHCGIPLKDAEAAHLLKATGGWISALYLSLLHYIRQGQLAPPFEVADLLASQVFDRLQDETRELLLVLSPLESFAIPQARLFCDNAENVLGDVFQRNAFVSYDPITGHYMLHAMFRQFLLARFDRLPVGKKQAICLRHAEWLVDHEEVRKSIKLLGRVSDSTKALELLNTFVERLPVTEGNGLLLALFRSFDPALMERYPDVMFRYAMAALCAGDMPVFSDVLDRLGRYCASLPEDGREANGWRGELELLFALTKYNDIEAMSVHHKRAAVFFDRSGTRKSRLFGQDPWTLGSPSVLYMFYRQSGALEETVAQMRGCLPYYSALTGMHGAGAEDVILAEARYNAGRFSSAAIACHQALTATQKHGQIGLEICARFLLARLDMQQGQYDKAIKQLETMRHRVEAARAFSLLRTLDLYTGLLHVDIQRPEKIPSWLLQEGEDDLYAFAGGCSYLVLGSALLQSGKHAELVGRFSRLLREGTFSKNLLFTIHAHLFMAAGNTGLGFWAEAEAALFSALDLALPDRLYMPFVTIAVFLPQLKSLKTHKTYGHGIRRILQLSFSFEKARNSIVSRYFCEETLLLTPRERELVQLAMTGMTYKKIAAATGLAPNSVKRYFATLYKKLGVSSREQLMQYLADNKGSSL